MPAAELLAMRGICKSFGAVRACDHVDLTLHRGDVLGLLGENGAGKTTLMNILFGSYAADEGSIAVDGNLAEIRSSADALALGIGMVHQHFHLVARHTVLENLMVGRKGRGLRLDREGAQARLAEIGRHFRLHLEPEAVVGDLTIGEQQRLEIIKALFRGARILILDEPTAALTPAETEGLFDAVAAMSAEGMGVILISHKLQEVRRVTSRIMVMRRGRVVADLPNDATVTERTLAELMCGRALSPPEKPPGAPGRALLRLEVISTAGSERRRLKELSLTLRAGEILGIAGVAGNGQRELADVIAGMLEPLAGRIEVDGRTVERLDPRRAQALRIGRIPEDRIGTGLLMQAPLADSMVLSHISEPPFSRHGLLDRAAIRAFAETEIEKFAIRAAGPMVRTGTLSGGNLQKALLARELAWDPLVVIASQPTRGLDVGATQFVQGKFLELRATGCGLIIISEDLEELFQIADRIAVMSGGRIVGDFPIGEAGIETIGLLMAGGDHRRLGMIHLRLERRSATPAWFNLALPLIAVAAALILCSGLVALAGADVLSAYAQLFLTPFSTGFDLEQTAIKAAPLVLTGLAVAVAFRARFWNIGGEGQLYAGAMAAAFAGTQTWLPGGLLWPAMILFGALAGAAWALLPAALRTRFKVDDVVTTLLLNFILLYGISALLNGPWKNPRSAYPTSPPIRPEAEFPILPGTEQLHLGVVVALLALPVVWFILNRTTFGFCIKAVGENARATAYAGISTARTILATAALSGALAGLAGAGEVGGVHYQVMADLSPGYGYTGIVIAMLARLSPLGVLPAAVFYAAMITGAEGMSRATGVPVFLADVIQGVSLLTMLTALLFTQYQLRAARHA